MSHVAGSMIGLEQILKELCLQRTDRRKNCSARFVWFAFKSSRVRNLPRIALLGLGETLTILLPNLRHE